MTTPPGAGIIEVGLVAHGVGRGLLISEDLRTGTRTCRPMLRQADRGRTWTAHGPVVLGGYSRAGRQASGRDRTARGHRHPRWRGGCVAFGGIRAAGREDPNHWPSL